MAYNIRWRRAILVSVFCHVFIVAGAGYLSAQLLIMPAVQEQYIELELSNEFPAPQLPDHNQSPVSTSPTTAAEPTLAPEKMKQDSNITPSPVTTTQSVVSTGELAVANTTSSNETTVGSAESISKGDPTSHAGTSGKLSSIIPPSILSKVAPSYPESARQGGIEGTVVLKIQILENGRADTISLSRSSGSEVLDDAAIATIKQWRFIPAKDRNGQAISCYTTIPISFRLHQ